MATQSEIAEHIDLSVRQVQRLLQSAVLPVSKGSRGYDLDACRVAYINYLRSKAQQGDMDAPEDEEAELSGLEQKKLEEDYLWTKERRIAQQLKNEIASRQQVPTEFAMFALSRLAAEVAAILDTLPLTLKRRHPDLETRHLDTLNRELARARNQAADLGDSLPGILDDYLSTIDESA